MKFRQLALAVTASVALTAAGIGVGYFVTYQARQVVGGVPTTTPTAGDAEGPSSSGPTRDGTSAPVLGGAQGLSPTPSAPTARPSATRTSPSRPSATPSRRPDGPADTTPAETPPDRQAARSQVSKVLALTNSERARTGCTPLRINTRLAAAAQSHTRWQVDHGMSHTGEGGSAPWDRASAAGYRWLRVGENVAAGYGTASAVMAGWMNSPGHRANILNCTFREIGIGLADGGGGPYWTQLFASPATAGPANGGNVFAAPRTISEIGGRPRS